MRLASYHMRGRPSFGAVVGDGIVDLRASPEPVFDPARGLSRPGARSGQGRQCRRAAGHAACRSRASAAASGAGEDSLHRHQLPEPRARLRLRRAAEISEHVLPGAEFGGRQRPKADPAENLRAARLRGRDRAGDRPRVQTRAERERARRDRRADAVQRGHDPRLDPARQIQRHPGQEFRRERQHRAVDRDRRRSDKAASARRCARTAKSRRRTRRRT